MDSRERVASYNVYAIFGELLSKLLHNNDDYKVILYKAGLKDFEDKYSTKLTPFIYNQGFENRNTSFNPEYACISICEEIENESDALILFFNTILCKISKIETKLLIRLENYLQIIGFELEEREVEYDEKYNYTLKPSSEGIQVRRQDMDYLLSMLSKHHADLLHNYNEAIENYGNGNYSSCIGNSRSLFEGFFKKLDTNNNSYSKGILVATKEQVVDKNGKTLTSKKDIFNYWLQNNKGANRYRLFVTMYSVMSGLGAHPVTKVSKEDALLLLRFTEDTLLWCFRNGLNC